LLMFSGQYKSLLDVTHEENEEEVNAAISESPLVNRRSNGERPKSLDFSTLGDTLSIAGVTIATSSTGKDSYKPHTHTRTRTRTRTRTGGL